MLQDIQKINLIQSNKDLSQCHHKIVVFCASKDIKDIFNISLDEEHVLITNKKIQLKTPLGSCVGLVGRKVLSTEVIIGFLTHFFGCGLELGLEKFKTDLAKLNLSIKDFDIKIFGGNKIDQKSIHEPGKQNRAKLKDIMGNGNTEFEHEQYQGYGNALYYNVHNGHIVDEIAPDHIEHYRFKEEGTTSTISN